MICQGYISSPTGKSSSLCLRIDKGGESRYQINFMVFSESEHPVGDAEPLDTRPDAPVDAVLELVIEGTNYRCKDGTIIGSTSDFAKEFFSRAAGLEPRHLLVGKEGGCWFLFTPRTVRRPFLLDGSTLPRGERCSLKKVRHHVEFDELRFGLRLLPVERTGYPRWAGSLLRPRG